MKEIRDPKKDFRKSTPVQARTVVLGMIISNQIVCERTHGLRFASAIRILAMRLGRSHKHLECNINACGTPSKRKTGTCIQLKPPVPSRMLLVFLPCTCYVANIILSAKRRWVKRPTNARRARTLPQKCVFHRVWLVLLSCVCHAANSILSAKECM